MSKVYNYIVMDGYVLFLFYTAKYDLHRIRRIRNTIQSVPEVLGKIHKNPDNSSYVLGTYLVLLWLMTIKQFILVERLKQLFKLEAQYGPPPEYIPALNQLIDYYNKVIYMSE